MNRGGTVHGERRGVSALHQIVQHRRKAALDHVAAQPPEDRLVRGPRPAQRFHHAAKRVACENLWQRIQPATHATALRVRRCEVFHPHLATARAERYGLESREVDRLNFVFAHNGTNMVAGALSNSETHWREYSWHTTLFSTPPPYSSSSSATPARAYRWPPRVLRPLRHRARDR